MSSPVAAKVRQPPRYERDAELFRRWREGETAESIAQEQSVAVGSVEALLQGQADLSERRFVCAEMLIPREKLPQLRRMVKDLEERR
jgi:hypothetical protein